MEGLACGKEKYSAGLSTLHFAARNGAADFLQEILKKRFVVSEGGLQPIHIAAGLGHVAILRILLEHSKDSRSLLEARNSLSPAEGRLLGKSNKFEEDIRQACPIHFAVSPNLLNREHLSRQGATTINSDYGVPAIARDTSSPLEILR